MTLSQDRAEAVTRFLADSGIPSERMIATGHQKGYPQANNATRRGASRTAVSRS